MNGFNKCNNIIETNSLKFMLLTSVGNNNLNLGYIQKIIILLQISIEIYFIVGLTGLQKYLF